MFVSASMWRCAAVDLDHVDGAGATRGTEPSTASRRSLKVGSRPRRPIPWWLVVCFRQPHERVP